MEYGYSSETEKEVLERVLLVGRTAAELITMRLGAGELANIDVKIGYVPIIMSPELTPRYPARTKVSHKRRALECAPQLDYEIFLRQSLETVAKEYVRGIIDCLPLLSRLGLHNSEIGQVEQFFAHVSADLQDDFRAED